MLENKLSRAGGWVGGWGWVDGWVVGCLKMPTCSALLCFGLDLVFGFCWFGVFWLIVLVWKLDHCQKHHRKEFQF
jgi:hypothetical protein